MLAVLCACGALARTLSMCLDAMTGGLARIMILGMNKKWKKKLLKLKLDFKYLISIFRPQFTSKRAMARCIGCWCGIFSHWHVYVGPRGMLMIFSFFFEKWKEKHIFKCGTKMIFEEYEKKYSILKMNE